jgi:hypothetical protein
MYTSERRLMTYSIYLYQNAGIATSKGSLAVSQANQSDLVVLIPLACFLQNHYARYHCRGDVVNTSFKAGVAEVS